MPVRLVDDRKPSGVRLVDDRPGVRIVDDTPEQSESYLPTAIRVGAGLVGGIGGTLVGGALGAPGGPAGIATGAAIGGRAGSALGSGAGEALAEYVEGRDLNPYAIGTEAVLGGAMMGGKAAATLGRNALKRAGEAAGFSLASDPVRAWSEGEPLWDPERALTSAAVGAVVGGGIGAGESALLRRLGRGVGGADIPAGPETPPQAAPEPQAATQGEPLPMPFDMQPPVAVDELAQRPLDMPPKVDDGTIAVEGFEPTRFPREFLDYVQTTQDDIDQGSFEYRQNMEQKFQKWALNNEWRQQSNAPLPFEDQPVAVEGPVGTVPQENLSPAPARVSEPAAPEAAAMPFEAASRSPHPDLDLQPSDRGWLIDKNRLRVNAQEFQFKTGVDPATGEGGHLADVETFKPSLANEILAWRNPQDGEVYVVEGHNRYGIAMRDPAATKVAVEFADVDTAADAKALGALYNIAHGHGQPIDVAKMIRASDSKLTLQQMTDFGLGVRNRLVRDGIALGGLDDSLFRKIEIGELTQERGALIGREVPDHANQRSLVTAMQQRGRELTDRELTELVRFAKGGESIESTQVDLFGTSQIQRGLMLEKAQLSSFIKQQLQRTKQALGYVSKGSRQETLKQGGNVINPERSGEMSQRAAQVLELYDRFSVRSDHPVGAALNAAAKELAQGGDLNAIQRRVTEETIAALEPEVATLTGALRAGTGEAGLGRTIAADLPDTGQLGLTDAPRTEAPVGLPFEAGIGEKGAFDPMGIGSALLHPRQSLQQLRENATAARAAQMGDIAARQGEQAPPTGPSINETFLEGRPAGNAPAYGVGEDLQAPGWGRDTSQQQPSVVDALDSQEGLEGFIHNLALKHRDEIDQARRGVVSHEQVEMRARVMADGIQKQLGIDPTGVIESMRQNGEALNSEGLQTLAFVGSDLGKQLMIATAKAARAGRSIEDDVDVLRIYTIMKGLLPQRAGATAEAGRTMNTAKQIIAQQGKNQQALEALIEGNGLTPETFAELKRMALSIDPDDPKAVNAFWQEAANTPATRFEKFREYYLSMGLLSGVKSFFSVQLASQGAAVAVEAPVKGLASVVDRARAALTGTQQERFSGEATEYVMGLAKGIPNAVKQGFLTFESEISDPKFRGSAGIEREMQGAYRPSIEGTTGRVVRLPVRAMGGFDDMAMNLTYDGHMATLLRREALRRGVPEAQVIDFADKAMRDMPNLIRSRRGQDAWAKAAHQEAVRFAREVNFKGDDGPFTKWVKGVRNVPGWGQASWVLMPFITTPVHLARAGGRTLISPLTLSKLMFEGPGRGGQWSDEVARSILGTMFVAGVAIDYAAGNITGGGPRDPAERDAKRRGEDWEPYSRKVNGEWVSYQRLDPSAITTGVIVDALEGFNTTDPVSAVTAMSTLVANNVMQKTYSAGLQSFMEAVSDPQRNGPKWAARVAGPILVPSIVNQIARSEDPFVHRPKTFGESMTQRLPGAVRSPIARMFEAAGNAAGYPFKIDTDLPPVRDVFGEPVEIYGTFLERMLNPFPRVPERTKDPAYKELIDVGYVPQGGRTTLGLRVQGLAGKIELSRSEVDMFETIGGRLAKRRVEALIALPGYQRLDPEQKKFHIQRAFTKAHEAAGDVVAAQVRAKAIREGRVKGLRRAGQAPPPKAKVLY